MNNNFITNYVELLTEQTKHKSLNKIITNTKKLIDDLSQTNFIEFLCNESIHNNSKKKLIKYVCETYDLKNFTYIFYAIVDFGRADFLFEILHNFILFNNNNQEFVFVDIYSPYKLSRPIIKNLISLTKQITKKEVKYNFNIDKALIGGFIIKGEDFIIDKSIKSQLENIRTSIREEI